MKPFSIILLAVIFITCQSSKADKTLTLTLENNAVYFLGPGEINHYKYVNSTAEQKAQNIIIAKITNPSSKKLLLAFNIDEITPSVNLEKSALGYLGFLIKSKDQNIEFSQPLVEFQDSNRNSLLLYESKTYNDSLKHEKYKSLGVLAANVDYVDNFLKNSFIINPGETKTFKFVLKLPIIQEISARYLIDPILYKDLNESQKFQLFYSCDGNALKSALPKYVVDELDKNNVEIYDGVLSSNIVPLKLKK